MTRLVLTFWGVCLFAYAPAQAILTFNYDAAGNQVRYRYCKGDCGNEGARTSADSLKLQEKTILASGGHFYLFPNPTDGVLALAFEGVTGISEEAQVTDASGRTFRVLLQPQANGNMRRVDLSALPTGVYLLRFNADGEEVVKRILKQ